MPFRDGTCDSRTLGKTRAHRARIQLPRLLPELCSGRVLRKVENQPDQRFCFDRLRQILVKTGGEDTRLHLIPTKGGDRGGGGFDGRRRFLSSDALQQRKTIL